MKLGNEKQQPRKNDSTGSFHSLLHLGELSVKLGYLVSVILDEVPRPLYAVQPGPNDRRQLALGRRQLFPKIRAHLSDVLCFVFVFSVWSDCGAGGRDAKITKFMKQM